MMYLPRIVIDWADDQYERTYAYRKPFTLLSSERIRSLNSLRRILEEEDKRKKRGQKK